MLVFWVSCDKPTYPLIEVASRSNLVKNLPPIINLDFNNLSYQLNESVSFLFSFNQISYLSNEKLIFDDRLNLYIYDLNSKERIKVQRNIDSFYPYTKKQYTIFQEIKALFLFFERRGLQKELLDLNRFKGAVYF